MRGRMVVGLGVLVLVVAWLVPAAAATPGSPGENESAFYTLTGDAAASFVVAEDLELVRTLELGELTYERYRQVHEGATVLGGETTIYRNGAGTITRVIGARYDVTATNRIRVSRSTAAGAAERDLGARGNRAVELMINPDTGRFFYRVETRAFDLRFVHWVDAGSGAVVNRYDALETNHGIGVKGDSKSTAGITTFHNASGHGARGSHYDLTSPDNRQITYDAKNRSAQLYFVTDKDDHWLTTGRTSPGQPALLDAQYYANVSDDYFRASPGFDWSSCYAQQRSVAHYQKNYNNAFWNGTYTVYGDGDGITFREMSGGLDVVAHEHTHGITDCTSNLVYQDESGALNESFSDILGNSSEFYAAANGRDGSPADWWIGEDVYVPADAVPGFRNMASPAEDDDPDHYTERYTGTDDNGGVHSNSGIPNHAYFLLVNGGRNAGEALGHAHSGPTVVGVGLADAERIFFQAFVGLPTNANMCNARVATTATAEALYGATSQQVASTKAAWEAVGLTAALCGA
jgi:bacillolysin